jgi:hypothetical protein
MTPGKSQLAAVATANSGRFVQLLDPTAAQRAVSEAVDCNAPFVHINNPPLMIARHSGRNMPATNPNSRAVAPLRPRARSVKRIIGISAWVT